MSILQYSIELAEIIKDIGYAATASWVANLYFYRNASLVQEYFTSHTCTCSNFHMKYLFVCIVHLFTSVCVCALSKQDMIEILKDYGKQNVTIKSVARVLGQQYTWSVCVVY